MVKPNVFRLVKRFCVLLSLVVCLMFSLTTTQASYCPSHVPCPELWDCNPFDYGCHCVSPECCALYAPGGDGPGPCPDPQ